MRDGQQEKRRYEAPKMKTYEAAELEEELGLTNGSAGNLDLDGGGEVEGPG